MARLLVQQEASRHAERAAQASRDRQVWEAAVRAEEQARAREVAHSKATALAAQVG